MDVKSYLNNHCFSLRRDQDLDSVLKMVRFRQISTKFLRTRVMPELVEGEGKFRADVEEALASRWLSQENKDYGTPRNAGKIVYLVSMQTSKIDRLACVPCPELTCGIKDDNYRCAAVEQDELYVVSKMSVSRFNPVTKKWTLVCEGGRWIYLIQIFITNDLGKKLKCLLNQLVLRPMVSLNGN